MSYSVFVLRSAERELERVPRRELRRIFRVIDSLGDDPRRPGAQKLRGLGDCYRVRQGHYRILYRIDDSSKRVFVYAVGHRKDVYR